MKRPAMAGAPVDTMAASGWISAAVPVGASLQADKPRARHAPASTILCMAHSCQVSGKLAHRPPGGVDGSRPRESEQARTGPGSRRWPLDEFQAISYDIS